eukprot:scaffold41536_cov63-Phaeocystis_antarctica.AAC.4
MDWRAIRWMPLPKRSAGTRCVSRIAQAVGVHARALDEEYSEVAWGEEFNTPLAKWTALAVPRDILREVTLHTLMS